MRGMPCFVVGRSVRSRAQELGRSLDYHDFRWLVLGQFGRGYAQWTQVTALPPIALGLGGSPSDVGLLWAMQFGPILLLAPFGGALADRYRRSRLLAGLHVVLATVAVTTAVALMLGAVGVGYLLVSALAFGLVTAVEMPVRQSLVADLVPSSHLGNGIALHQAAFNVTRIGGPVATTTILLLVGPAPSMAVGAIASLAAAVSLRRAALGHDQREQQPSSPAGTRGGRSAVVGIVTAWATPTIRRVLVLIAITSALGMSFQSVIAVHLDDVLHLAPAVHGYAIGAIGVGTLVGSVSAAGRPGTMQALWVAAAVLCSLVVVFALSPSLPAILAVCALVGCAYGIVAAFANFLVQAAAEPHIRGRVIGTYLAALNGSLAIGSLMYGVAAETAGTTTVMLMGGAGGVLGLLIASVLFGGLPRRLLSAPRGS